MWIFDRKGSKIVSIALSVFIHLLVSNVCAANLNGAVASPFAPVQTITMSPSDLTHKTLTPIQNNSDLKSQPTMVTTSINEVFISNDGTGKIWNKIALSNLPESELKIRNITCNIGECILVGSIATQPLLMVSTASAKKWTKRIIADLPQNSQFKKINCVKRPVGAAFCSAIGETSDKDNSKSFVTISQDGGTSWTVVKSLNKIKLNAISCFNNTNAITCVGVGYYQVNAEQQILVITRDSGKTWTTQQANDVGKGNFVNVSCSGKGKTAVCAVVGTVNAKKEPVIFVSTNGANDWKGIVPDGLPQTIDAFDLVECAGNGKTALCAATGPIDYTNEVLRRVVLVSSVDGGRTWAHRSLDVADSERDHIYEISCAQSADKSYQCRAAGGACTRLSGGRECDAYYADTLDGVNWFGETYDNNLHSAFFGANCSNVKGSILCFAVGHNHGDPYVKPYKGSPVDINGQQNSLFNTAIVS